MTLYVVVTFMEYEPTSIHGVYTSMESAMLAKGGLWERDIVQFEADAPPVAWTPDPLPDPPTG